tara:strand:- start:13 stop:189 length:177 start_codon:yes stop_codon:yes gene_type:complete
MNITSAQYYLSVYDDSNDGINATINGVTLQVPLDPNNRHYAAILEWAEEDGNEIQAAE